MDDSPFSLINRHILITGASSGIGQAIAIEASRMGAQVTALGRNQERLSQTLDAMEGKGHQSFTLDLCNRSELADIVLQIDHIDGVVHSAGISSTAPAKFITEEDLKAVLAVNVIAPIELTKLLLQKKKIAKNASLIFISSVVSGIHPYKAQGVYAASKGALNAYAKVLALELATRKIRVNSILPAMVRTKFIDSISVGSESLNSDEKRYPLGYGTPEDVAWAAIYLLSEATRWMTGNELIIDGGVTLT